MASDPSPTIERIDPSLPQRILDAAPRVRTFLRRLCRGARPRREADVDDLTQDVMERAIRYRHAFDADTGTLDNWLMKTAFHSYLDHRAKAQRRPAELGLADTAVPAPGQGDEHAADLRDEVGFLLSRLSPVEQDIVLRFHQRRETVAEIAADLEMPEGTVKSHLHRARRRLADHRREE